MKKLRVKAGHQLWYKGFFMGGALLDYDEKLSRNSAVEILELPDPPIEISFAPIPEIVITPQTTAYHIDTTGNDPDKLIESVSDTIKRVKGRPKKKTV